MFSDAYGNLFNVCFRTKTKDGEKELKIVVSYQTHKVTLKDVEKTVSLYVKKMFGEDCSATVISYSKATKQVSENLAKTTD